MLRPAAEPAEETAMLKGDTRAKQQPFRARLATLHGTALALLCVLASCDRPAPPPAGPPHDAVIIPGVRIGPVGRQTAERELIDLLGPERVVRRDISIGEGFCSPGTVLHPGMPDSLEIIWTDTTYTLPALVQVSGEDSQWRTPAGVHVGMTLTELEAIGGQPVQFTGFAWDYGGTGSWSEQTAEGSGEMFIRLSPDSASHARARQDLRYEEIIGEKTVSSDHPLIRSMTIRIERILIRWGESSVQRQCPL
jgi:hypothetical protein